MNAATENWVAVGSLDDIPARGSRSVLVGETKLAVFRTAENEIFALEDACPHKGAPLSQGIVHDNCVTCPLHNWVISLQSGHAQGADEGSTRQFSVKLEGDAILLNLSDLNG